MWRLGRLCCRDTPRGSYFSESECSARTISSVNRESSSLLDDGICDKSCFGASSLSSFDIRQCATPDSAMSIGGSDAYYCHKTASSHHDLPSKLQLIKPMEGSVTLAKWQLLATPNMGAFLESRPGIYNRSQDPEADKIIADVATKKELRGIEQGTVLWLSLEGFLANRSESLLQDPISPEGICALPPLSPSVTQGAEVETQPLPFSGMGHMGLVCQWFSFPSVNTLRSVLQYY